ncbi:MAG: hypothetical protein ACPGXK_14580 [Phycisphaerae bacterium]
MDRPIVRRRMTPDECLNLLREYIHELGALGLNTVTEIEADTTLVNCLGVLDEYVLDDIEEWGQRHFGLSITSLVCLEGRQQVITVGELCHLIAGHASRPAIEPVTILGSTCHAAGYFLAMRSMMREQGSVQADTLLPSTKLRSIAKGGLKKIVDELIRIQPKLVHVITLKWKYSWLTRVSGNVFTVVWIFMLAGGVSHVLSGASPLFHYSTVLCLLSCAAAAVFGMVLTVLDRALSRHHGKARLQAVHIKGLDTVRDLCVMLAGESPVMPRGNCLKCGYNLTGMNSGRCPECNADFAV